jgi:hypothetical protein
MATFRSGTVTNTSTNITTRSADVLTLNIINRHSAVIYVRFYSQTVATFQDTPIATVTVPASGGSVRQVANPIAALFSGTKGLCVRVVTDATDTGNTAAATLPIIELEYK